MLLQSNFFYTKLRNIRKPKSFYKNMKVTVLDMKPFPNFLQSNYPLNTGRKLNVSKTFSKRPERLLNVLCGCNLHPVPRGRRSRFSAKLPASCWPKFLFMDIGQSFH